VVNEIAGSVEEGHMMGPTMCVWYFLAAISCSAAGGDSQAHAIDDFYCEDSKRRSSPRCATGSRARETDRSRKKVQKGADMGASASACWVREAGSGGYREIELEVSGDWSYKNTAPAARKLVRWLASVAKNKERHSASFRRKPTQRRLPMSPAAFLSHGTGVRISVPVPKIQENSMSFPAVHVHGRRLGND